MACGRVGVTVERVFYASEHVEVRMTVLPCSSLNLAVLIQALFVYACFGKVHMIGSTSRLATSHQTLMAILVLFHFKANLVLRQCR